MQVLCRVIREEQDRGRGGNGMNTACACCGGLCLGCCMADMMDMCMG